STESTGAISATVAPHGVALLRVSRTRSPIAAPPSTAAALTGPTTLSANQPTTVAVSLTDNGPLPLLGAKLNLALDAPSVWTVKRTGRADFPVVGSGQTVTATYQVTA